MLSGNDWQGSLPAGRHHLASCLAALGEKGSGVTRDFSVRWSDELFFVLILLLLQEMGKSPRLHKQVGQVSLLLLALQEKHSTPSSPLPCRAGFLLKQLAWVALGELLELFCVFIISVLP